MIFFSKSPKDSRAKLHMPVSCAFIAAAVSLCLFSCAKKTDAAQTAKSAESSSEPQAAEGGSITLGFATEMNNFDPFTSMTADARSINFNIFDGLVNVASDGSFVPAIAESYTVSEDAKTWSFTLRKGVRFHDSKTLSADDVLYSVRKAMVSDMAGYNKIQDLSCNKEGVLTIRLKTADAGFIAYLTTPIVEKDAKNLALKPVGTGPYQFSEYIEQDHITLERNKNYWGTKPHLDRVTIKFASSQADLVLNFQAGSIDGFSANADTVEQLNKNDIRLYQRNSNSVQLLALNNSFAPFKDENVRKALNYLVDADEIITAVNYGYGVKVGSSLIPALTKYYDESLAESYPVNVQKAKELLAASSYADGFSFTITVPSVYTVHVKTAEVIVNELAKAGIKAEIKQVDWATWLQNVYSARQYEATIISLDGPLAYPTSYLSRYCSDAHNNFVNFSSAAYDSAYANAVSTTDEGKKTDYFKQCQQILSREAASVFIEDISMLTVYNKNFAGNKDYPLYAIDLSAIYKVR